MSPAARRIQARRKAKAILEYLIECSENIIVVHYSCQGFKSRAGSSPRITSIAVMNLHSRQTESFSIHQEAEIAGYSSKNFEPHYNDLERKMLDKFYEFVKSHHNCKWLHWNMRNMNFGFQAIEHRYSVLGGQPAVVLENNKHDLSGLLYDIYGADYAEHPHLQNLVRKNEMNEQDFLAGSDEAIAFEEREYVKLHQSTLRKVSLFASIAHKAETGSLKTNSTWHDIYGSYPAALGELIKEHWIFVLIGFASAVSSIYAIFR